MEEERTEELCAEEVQDALPGTEELPEHSLPTALPQNDTEEDAAGDDPEQEQAESPEASESPESPEEALRRQLREVTSQLAVMQAQSRMEQQLNTIARMDPELGSLAALAQQPEFPEFDRLVQGGQDLVSAYKLAFFDRYARRSASAARQAAINQARAKEHLACVGSGCQPQDDGLTDELIRSYRLYNPGMSRQEIARYHAKYRKEKQNV